MCRACVLQRGHSGDGCGLASTLCKYGLRMGSRFVCSEMGRGSISSELLMCGGGVRSILLLPRVARCLETIVCIYNCMYVVHVGFYLCCSDLGGGGLWECVLYSGHC